MSGWIYTACLKMLMGARRRYQVPGVEAADSFELPQNGYWESNLDSLEEQQAILPTKRSLQPP